MKGGETLQRVREHMLFRGVAYAVLFISIVFSLLAYFYARQNLDSRNGVQFQEAVLISERSIDRRTDAYTDALYGARAYFESSQRVEDYEWAQYISGLEIGDRYSGFQALGYVDFIATRAELGDYPGPVMRNSRNERPADDRGYSLVRFIGPENTANSRFVGRDLNLQQEHLQAMETARDTGRATATSRVFVLTESQGSGADLALNQGFFVYLPVYREGEDIGSVSARRDALEGFIFGSFRMDQLLGNILGSELNPNLDFEVYDGAEASRASLLYDRDGIERATDSSFLSDYSAFRSLQVAGRDWTLYFTTLPGFIPISDASLPLFILLGGLGASLALFAATWLLASSRERAERVGTGLADANRNLATANHELEAFSYSVSHDLRAPLRSIEGFSQILLEDYSDKLDDEGVGYLNRVRASSRRMSELIDDLLQLSRVTRSPLKRESMRPDALAREVGEALQREEPSRQVDWHIPDMQPVSADPRLLRIVLENLIGNAWKFTSKQDEARIEFGTANGQGKPDQTTFFVRDNGAGFEMAYAEKLFGAFQRLHTEDEFEGTGIGLATVARIVHRHGGNVRAEGELGQGATIYFSLGNPERSERGGQLGRIS